MKRSTLVLATVISLISLACSDAGIGRETQPRFDCLSTTPATFISIGSLKFWIPAGFEQSNTGKDDYDWILHAETNETVITHSVLRIHHGTMTKSKFSDWVQVELDSSYKFPELELVEKTDEEAYGLTMYGSAVIIGSEFVEVYGKFQVSWPDILGCISN